MTVIGCPHCGTKYKVDPAKFSSPKPKIRCKKCENVFEADLAGGDSDAAPAPAPAPAAPAPAPKPAPAPAPAAAPRPAAPPPPAPPAAKPAPPTAKPAPALRKAGRVVVAIEDAATQEACRKILSANGHTVTTFGEGIAAFVSLVQTPPDVAILSVSLPKMYGHEIADILRRDPAFAGIKLMLLAGTFDAERYKRDPSQLYGAQAFIEKQNIEGELENKIQGLLSGGAATPKPAAAAPAAAPRPAAAPPPPAPAPKPAAPTASAPAAVNAGALAKLDPDVVKRAERLARIIVSDIALYNQKAIETGIKGGDYKAELTNDLAEAKRHFAEKFAPDVIAAKDFIEAALDAYIANKRAAV